MPTLFVDADACPHVRAALSCARRARVPCVLVSDAGHDLSRHLRATDAVEPRPGFWVRRLTVAGGADAADFAIVSELEPSDVVVTADIGLASMVLGRGAYAIDDRGRVFDKETIDALLLVRHATKRELARARGRRPRVGTHRALTSEDRARFSDALTALLARAKEDLRRR